MVVKSKMKSKMKNQIESSCDILRKCQEENELADANYRQWLYWNDWGLLFPVEIEKLFSEEIIILN